jgi:hypothetical protein
LIPDALRATGRAAAVAVGFSGVMLERAAVLGRETPGSKKLFVLPFAAVA